MVTLQQPLHWDDTICALFVSWLLSLPTKNIKAVSARSYLYGAKDLIRSVGGFAAKETPMTNKVLKGHKRLFKFPKRTRKPITLPILKQMLRELDFANDHDSLILAALFSVAFFGLVRMGDLTKANNIFTKDIEFSPSITSPTFVRIHLHQTKTSQFEGQTLILGCINSPFCPVILLRCIFQTYKPPQNRHFC